MKSTECTIYIEGGIIQWVGFNGDPMPVDVIDGDTEGADEEDLTDVTFTDGKSIEMHSYGISGFSYGTHDFFAARSYKEKKSSTVYVDFLNKEKNHQEDRAYFDTWDQAKSWCIRTMDSFNPDMINYI